MGWVERVEHINLGYVFRILARRCEVEKSLKRNVNSMMMMIEIM
jgi:hypothetical protein